MAKRSSDMNDIVGTNYGDYTVLSYEGKNKSGTHIYKIKFNNTGNIAVRTRQSVRKGDLKDTKDKKNTVKKNNISNRRKKGREYSKGDKENMLYGVFDITKNTLILDQSTKNTGYAIIIDDHIDKYGIIVNNNTNLSVRIYDTIKDIKSIIEKYNIKNIVLESIFLGYDPTVYMKLSMVIGAISLFCVGNNINLMTVSNPTWRSIYDISGGRSFCKAKSLKVAKKILNGKTIYSNDISDAVCMAEYLLISRGIHKNIYNIEYKIDTSNVEMNGFC